MSEVCILWDESHLWGLLVQRACLALGIASRLVTGLDVAHGFLEARSPKLLIVPGGNARAKESALGREGVAAIREYVRGGGSYLGFCGGAGLGLTGGGLSLCPWCRKPFDSRMQHFVSGFMRILPGEEDPFVPPAARSDEAAEFPVWWPGRFEVAEGGGVEVLARYAGPGSELWVADLRLDHLPVSAFDDWQAEYGLELWPSFMQGQPCVVRGQLGAGSYVLSYAHLETPDAPEANRWLVHILSRLLGRELPTKTIPAWIVPAEPVRWDDPVLARARRVLREVVRLGQEQFLLFDRAPWLIGWRRGLPGLQLNALRTLVRTCQGHEPPDRAERFWADRGPRFARDLDIYHQAVTGYLLAERLDMTLSHSPDAPAVTGLRHRREAIFGPPQAGGGLHGGLQSSLEELARLLLNGA